MVNPENLADETAAVEQRIIEAKKDQSDDLVWLPNATKVHARPFVEMRTRMNRSQYEIFTNEEKTRTLLKNPKPGYHYHWARSPQYDPSTGMRVAMGLYQYVSPTELKADVSAIFTNHKGASGNMVGYGTLVLVSESPEAYRETHLAPQVEAIAALGRVKEEFMGGIEEESKGRAQGTVERVVEKEVVHKEDDEH